MSEVNVHSGDARLRVKPAEDGSTLTTELLESRRFCFFNAQISFAFSKAPDRRLFVFWQVRACFVKALGSGNDLPHKHVC
jgi:hypothetical protein